MMKLLIAVIVAGLVFESHQDDARKVVVKPPFLPFPCHYPIHHKCWTEWFDLDDPCGEGDFELLKNLRDKYPGKICPIPADIDVETVTGLSVAEAGDKVEKPDPLVGFKCKNEDQKDKKCHDYRVRFSCYSPFCDYKVCWTKFFDRDHPSGTGDWELLENLRKENPGEICEKPMFIEAVTSDGLVPAHLTGEKFHVFNPTKGFVCRRKDQKDFRCLDYKVRFACPCKPKKPEWWW